MARISLRETYDNRSVIAQIAKVTDTAEDAAETVQEKAAEINDALTDVNAAVQAAEGAVTTANAASASAQQSAQTVAGYNTRLTTAEGEIDTLQSDLNGVTLRVTTAEGQIVTIQGRVTALETADRQNVKINRINDYALGLSGNQSYSGLKTALDIHNALKSTSPNFVQGSDSITGHNFLIERISDANDNAVLQRYIERAQNNNRSYRQILSNKTTDNHQIVAYLDTRISNDGTVSLILIKTVDGAETGRVQLANITS